MPNPTNPSHVTNLGRCIRTTLRTLALAAALLTLTATTAAAQPNRTPLPGDQRSDPTIVRVIAPSNAFDWGDAGIGAAAGLALAMLGLGGTLALSQRRPRHPNSPPAPTS